MSFLLGVLIFVLALLFSIMLHEAGHFVTAKKFGMKVTQFFIGFGQTLWSRQKGETEYGVKAIPAGGYVKIVGMTEMEDVDPADEPRSFRRHPGWQRIIVLAVVLGGALRLWLYNTVIVDTFFNAPGQLAASVVGAPADCRADDCVHASSGARRSSAGPPLTTGSALASVRVAVSWRRSHGPGAGDGPAG